MFHFHFYVAVSCFFHAVGRQKIEDLSLAFYPLSFKVTALFFALDHDVWNYPAMTQIGFYHLTLSPLDQALPRLLEKALSAGHRMVVMAGSEERIEWLNSHLWTYSPDSWLPHGSRKDGSAADQPIWLTETDENPNQAQILILTDGISTARISDFERCLVLFDGNDPAALQTARSQWKTWKDEGHELVYLQQKENGGWAEKMRTSPVDQAAQ